MDHHPAQRLLTNRSTPPPPPPSAASSFPILAISLIGILATATLLLSYYVFVLKCCLSWQRRRSPSSPSLRHSSEPIVFYSAAAELRGLTPSSIHAIPVVRFSAGSGAAHDCAVCLNEFREEEGLRLLPGCAHAFHVDCIDIWLQSNANCPVCRCDISSAPITFPILASRDDHTGSVVENECVDAQPQRVRRSFSMDACLDRELDDGGGGDRRVRRGFFSFGHGRSSRSAVLPVQVELS